MNKSTLGFKLKTLSSSSVLRSPFQTFFPFYRFPFLLIFNSIQLSLQSGDVVCLGIKLGLQVFNAGQLLVLADNRRGAKEKDAIVTV